MKMYELKLMDENTKSRRRKRMLDIEKHLMTNKKANKIGSTKDKKANPKIDLNIQDVKRLQKEYTILSKRI